MNYEDRQLIKQKIDEHKRDRMRIASSSEGYGNRQVKCSGTNIRGRKCGSWALMNSDLCYYHQSQK